MTPRLAPLLLALAAALAPLPALAQEAEADAEAAQPAPALPSISVSPVGTRDLRDRVIASGLVAAVEDVQVQPLIEGQPIDELLVDVGDRVEEGQVLARLSRSTIELDLAQLAANRAQTAAAIAQAEASLSQARANADEAERQAARSLELAEAGSLPRAQADQAVAARDSAVAQVAVAEQGIASARAQAELVAAQVENAELRLARTEVKAPVAGLVVARNAQVGSIATAAGAAMFTIIRDGAMELRAEVAEMDLLRLAPGQAATLRSSEGSEPVAGTVRLVEPAIDPQTRLGIARISIDDAGRVVEGMFLTAEILVAEEQELAVPVTAMGSAEGRATVMRVRDGVVERVEVEPGIRDGGFIGIVSGLEEGDLVVTKAAAFVRDGDRINPVTEEQLADAAGAAPAEAPAEAPSEAPAAAPEAAPETAAPAEE